MEGLVSNSERRKTKVETPPMVPKSRRTQRRQIEATPQGHQLRVKATKLPRRQFLHLAAGAAVIPAMTPKASAQAYPTRAITMIVPFPAGGPVDAAARILAEPMKRSLGGTIIIENVGGADGNIATRLARSRPDGYTIDFGGYVHACAERSSAGLLRA
jgi:hypothetical protein